MQFYNLLCIINENLCSSKILTFMQKEVKKHVTEDIPKEARQNKQTKVSLAKQAKVNKDGALFNQAYRYRKTFDDKEI